VIQPFDENLPMVPHPDSTEVFPNRDAHFGETIEGNEIPLRPDKKEVPFKNFDIPEFSNHANHAIRGPRQPPVAYRRERRLLLQLCPNVDRNVRS